MKNGIIVENRPILRKIFGYFCIHSGRGIVMNLHKINSKIIKGSINIIRKDVKTNVLPVIEIKPYSGNKLSEYNAPSQYQLIGSTTMNKKRSITKKMFPIIDKTFIEK